MPSLQELRLKHSGIMSKLIQEGMLDMRYSTLKGDHIGDHSFSHKVMADFFAGAEKSIINMRKIVYKSGCYEQQKLDIELHLIKGPSDYIGTLRVSNSCRALRDAYRANDRKGCLACIKDLKKEFNIAKPYLEALMEVENQIWSAGGQVH